MAELCWINRNMRCIEIIPAVTSLYIACVINRNMRCIEMRQIKVKLA